MDSPSYAIALAGARSQRDALAGATRRAAGGERPGATVAGAPLTTVARIRWRILNAGSGLPVTGAGLALMGSRRGCSAGTDGNQSGHAACSQRPAMLTRHGEGVRLLPGSGPGHARVLVVDDEATIRDLLSGSLRFAGFEVVTAASGAEAVRAAARSRPDLILLDVMMPDGDGFEVARRLRADPGGIPMVFLTARDEVTDRVAGLNLGADDYVTKPFSLDEVLARVQAVLK